MNDNQEKYGTNMYVNLVQEKKQFERIDRIKRIKRTKRIKETGFIGALLFGFVFWGIAAFFTLWVYN